MLTDPFKEHVYEPYLNLIAVLFSSCPGGRNASQPCPVGHYNALPGQLDQSACKVSTDIAIVGI